jgi:carboxymethylenebutenolidase
LYAQHNAKVKAGVAWYGRMEGQTNANTPKHPIELVASLKAPVLGLYGGADTGIPVTSVNNMKEALAQAATKGNAAAKASEFVLYPDAPHAFHADYRASYRAAPAADGWTRALGWLKQYV